MSINERYIVEDNGTLINVSDTLTDSVIVILEGDTVDFRSFYEINKPIEYILQMLGYSTGDWVLGSVPSTARDLYIGETTIEDDDEFFGYYV